MDAFINAFIAIDERQDDVITTAELRRYINKNNLDTDMLQKWQKLFDPNNTGKITLESFCDKLGLKMSAVSRRREKVGRLSPDIKVIEGKMSLQDQIVISDAARSYFGDGVSFSPKTVTPKLKEFLDGKFGGAWQVMIVKGSYWITHSFVTGKCFHFQFKNYSYICWSFK